MKQQQEQGFTLLEVIIALAVLSFVLVPLTALFSNHIDAMKRIAEENDKSAAMHQVLTYMERINPAENATGEDNFQNFQIKYTTELLVDVKDLPGESLGAQFDINLYEADVQVTRSNNVPWFDMKLRLTGYEKKKNASAPQDMLEKMKVDDVAKPEKLSEGGKADTEKAPQPKLGKENAE